MLSLLVARERGDHILNVNKTLQKLNIVQRTMLLRMSGPYTTRTGGSLNMKLGITSTHLEVITNPAIHWLKKKKIARATEIIREFVNTIEHT